MDDKLTLYRGILQDTNSLLDHICKADFLTDQMIVLLTRQEMAIQEKLKSGDVSAVRTLLLERLGEIKSQRELQRAQLSYAQRKGLNFLHACLIEEEEVKSEKQTEENSTLSPDGSLNG